MELPQGVTVFERGWLSANNILFAGPGGATLVDTGYWTHAAQTVHLVERALDGQPLARVLNTHLHSDHCGGNAALQEAFTGVRTLIPPGQASHVREWDPVALSYEPTGQHCPQFTFDGLLEPGRGITLGGADWEIHAAPGHDPHSVILFEPVSRTLISADALWRNGFGVVFQELEGERAFDEVSATLDLIASLDPRLVIPGHGPVFDEVDDALAKSRRRLEAYLRDPVKHASHAAKVLLKFKLLEWQWVPQPQAVEWGLATAYLQRVHARYFHGEDPSAWLAGLLDDLIRSGAAARQGGLILNA